MNADTQRLITEVSKNRYTIDDLQTRTGFSAGKIRYHWRKIRTEYAPTNGLVAGCDPAPGGRWVYGLHARRTDALKRAVGNRMDDFYTRLFNLDLSQWQPLAKQGLMTKRLYNHLEAAKDEIILQLERLDKGL